jgi:hypothetical protein
MIKELLAAFYFQADSAFVGYGLAPLPLEAGEMLPAPSRAALDDGAGIGADLSHGGAGGFGRGIYAGTEQPGLPDKLMRDVRGEAGRRSRQSVGYHGSESLVSLVTTGNCRFYANSANSFHSQPAFGAKANYRHKSGMICGYTLSTAGLKVAVRSSNWHHPLHQPSR